MNVIKTIKDLNIFIDEFDNYRFYSSTSTVYFEYSYSHYADQEVEVEGEALEFLLKEEAEIERRRAEELRLSKEKRAAEEAAQAFKEANGGMFEFAVFVSGRWFQYEIKADSLADAERIGWELLAKDTAHWKGGSANIMTATKWSCQ